MGEKNSVHVLSVEQLRGTVCASSHSTLYSSQQQFKNLDSATTFIFLNINVSQVDHKLLWGVGWVVLEKIQCILYASSVIPKKFMYMTTPEKKINTCSVRQKSVLHWKKWPLQKKIHVQWGKKVCYTEKIPAHFLRKNSKWIKVLEKTAYAKSPTTTCHAKVYYYWLANPKCSPLQDFTELSKDALMKICKAP